MKNLTLVTIAAILVWLANFSLAAETGLAPSEVTALINRRLAFEPNTPRKELTGPLIARMTEQDLSELEVFHKGEAHFLHLEPEPARDVFWEFRLRDDDLGRVATQRLMIIRINAFSMVNELLESDIPAYRNRFRPRADDRYGITFAVMRTAVELAKLGRADDALDLLVSEVRAHEKFDSPYTAYALPQQFMEMAVANDRGDEFRELHQWVIDNLDVAIERRLTASAENTDQVQGIPGVVFRSLFEDQGKDYYAWTGEFLRLRASLD